MASQYSPSPFAVFKKRRNSSENCRKAVPFCYNVLPVLLARVMLASQLQLQEWDLQDITKEERGRGPIWYASGEEYEDETNFTFTYYYTHLKK